MLGSKSKKVGTWGCKDLSTAKVSPSLRAM